MATAGSKIKSCLRGSALTIATIIGVFSGVFLGLALRQRETRWTEREIMYITYPGELFLRMLKALILPLIVPSLIAAVGSLDMRFSGKVGARAVGYYMTTTVLAVILGIILVTCIHPGGQTSGETVRVGESRNVTAADTLMDLARNFVPPNIVQATVAHYRTILKYPGDEAYTDENGQFRDPKNFYTWKITGQYKDETNILGLVFFSVFLGITLAIMEERGKPLIDFFTCLSQAMMTITTWVIYLAPGGVFFLIGGQVLEMEDMTEVAGQLGLYFCTVLGGLFFHGFVVLPAIYLLLTREMPFKFIANMTNAMTTAFGTASSSATLPVTINLLEEKNGVDPRICRFVLPIGATINMDGTALYEAVAAIFIAQVRNMQLSLGQVIAISITATAASIGAAGIPQAGLVTMVMVLETVGLPAEDVTLILAVDWLLDRFRTAINVLGDSFGASLVYHLSKKELEAFN
ncbi:hypothetical protein TCAL_07613 [Tigriopus californicus]|uniref:Amino acid transporter n=2 Tax=Tigriopus californicus TaxID=6832 RepID=A0A553PIA5_TIGCA|nr:hypothetical protein TCAL_07613 [Tigriopus californicus]|eukprot:TCALIF_07613-PA protein Name:"Similar to SLC1A1 Excitatory amino acid transporter 3 (Oryctolagus cuniculus)" AED:0.04 eAED:0.04 QI:0/-1/0/1/-1/1/1/0/462